MALVNSLAGYYMLCTSEHVMGSYHPDLAHGTGLIMLSHEYFDFFAERKAAEEPMLKMAKAMGVENPESGKDFIKALDKLIADLRMSEHGLTYDKIAQWPAHCHELPGGDNEADPLPLSDEDYPEIFQRSFK